MKQNILVTGGSGFIGSNFLLKYVPKYPEINFINLDKLTYAANQDYIKPLDGLSNYHFIHGDICDSSLVQSIFEDKNITDVIHFAAESHVDNSITGPRAFIETNINGTFNLLESARKHWQESPHYNKEDYKSSRFHHISTDEVYGTLGEEGFFTETTPYAPNSPYSASKASSDMLVRSYFHTYGINVVTTNCSNNYGPGQHSEKLIPTVIRKCLASENIPIYGTGENIRDWLFVTDHCDAIWTVFSKGNTGETYNVGGNNELTNIELISSICDILNELKPQEKSYHELKSFVTDRHGHDFRYAIDASKLKDELGWTPSDDKNQLLRDTISYYLDSSK